MTTNQPEAGGLPQMPSNVSHVMRRIRRCENESAAQVVLEHFAMEYARAALATAAPLPRSAATVPEGWTLVPDHANADTIVTSLYRRFKDWSKRGFGPDDVTWCEVKADVLAMIAAAPRSAATVSDEREAFEALRSQMAYIAAYCPDESDGMSKDRLADRLRAIIERAHRAMSDTCAVSTQATATGGGYAPLTEEEVERRKQTVRDWAKRTGHTAAPQAGLTWRSAMAGLLEVVEARNSQGGGLRLNEEGQRIVSAARTLLAEQSAAPQASSEKRDAIDARAKERS
ncbi:MULTISPECIES: hypothetical protein [unclassified Paraburkholderia]|uniref:hypothetical protein n=1 Tax=unclassified Paraburkholderia TaxID=2615204 RepID=UPI001609399B|nr:MULTISPECIES: hypothetical protein [unclassified Paraburkholderia]MBB5444608.1 hypothetical protein [Paraburkholderia sp. WSM4177]MBB5485432.1 hypothetical protein [Paraburkholderia sp. WSM4180]